MSNREHIQKWLDRDPAAHAWSPYFRYVVETLEGLSEEEAVQREQQFRSKVKVFHVTSPRSSSLRRTCSSYDTVMSFFCLESGCKDLIAFKDGMKKLASLVKEEGYLLYLVPLDVNTVTSDIT